MYIRTRFWEIVFQSPVFFLISRSIFFFLDTWRLCSSLFDASILKVVYDKRLAYLFDESIVRFICGLNEG